MPSLLRLMTLGVLGKKKSKPSKASKGHTKAAPRTVNKTPNQYVGVQYRELLDTRALPPTDFDHGYTFSWRLTELPQRGMRVIVPGINGRSPGVVFRVGASERQLRELSGTTIKPVSRIVTRRELDDAYAAQASMIDDARVKVGFASKGVPAVKHDAVPPIKPTASSRTADHASTWWRLYKAAEEAGDIEAAEAFRSIGKNWYQLTDKVIPQ